MATNMCCFFNVGHTEGYFAQVGCGSVHAVVPELNPVGSGTENTHEPRSWLKERAPFRKYCRLLIAPQSVESNVHPDISVLNTEFW